MCSYALRGMSKVESRATESNKDNRSLDIKSFWNEFELQPQLACFKYEYVISKLS